VCQQTKLSVYHLANATSAISRFTYKATRVLRIKRVGVNVFSSSAKNRKATDAGLRKSFSRSLKKLSWLISRNFDTNAWFASLYKDKSLTNRSDDFAMNGCLDCTELFRHAAMMPQIRKLDTTKTKNHAKDRGLLFKKTAKRAKAVNAFVRCYELAAPLHVRSP